MRRARYVALLSVISVGLAAVIAAGQAPAAQQSHSSRAVSSSVTQSSIGGGAPTFLGPAATGCSTTGCSLLTGPFQSPAVTTSPAASASAASANANALTPSAPDKGQPMPSPVRPHSAVDPAPPGVSCQPAGAGCDAISSSNGGATSANGLDAVDSGTLPTNPNGDVEPPDQGLCAGNGYVVEANNIGEILVFNNALQRQSSPISLDTVMGLSSHGASGWSSGGDPSCEYDSDHGGHWFFTEFVSASSEASGGAFSGCFPGVAHACYEGIAVSTGSSPFGPYNVYFLSPDYNPNEPGYPSLLNDFAKIGVTRDAFLLFYDEFPLKSPGLGGGGFNGAQEFAFDKKALEEGLPTTEPDGSPNPDFNVAIENMGLLGTPDGNCDGTNGGVAGGSCWYQVIPAQPADSSQFDNSNGGTGFMLTSLDFFGGGDNRTAAFAWTGLSSLDSARCSGCGSIHFGGTLLSGVDPYYNPGFLASQKAGPIPLGAECGAAGLPHDPAKTPTCPEIGINTNGDGMTQVSQGGGQLWGAISTAVSQSFGPSAETHLGAEYWVVGTGSFDKTGAFSLTNQGYVSAAHENIEFPSIAAAGGNGNSQGGNGNSQGGNGNSQGGNGNSQGGGNGSALMAFSLSGNGGPTGADNGGYFPSTAYGWLTPSSAGLVGSTINIADLGQAPQDGFTQYLDYPNYGISRPRWGDYSWGIFSGGKFYFATEWIPFSNCNSSNFDFTKLGTCGGTRDGRANWGTSVNAVG